jgi:hypothetical protein
MAATVARLSVSKAGVRSTGASGMSLPIPTW